MHLWCVVPVKVRISLPLAVSHNFTSPGETRGHEASEAHAIDANSAREPFAVGAEDHIVDAAGEVLEQSRNFLWRRPIRAASPYNHY